MGRARPRPGRAASLAEYRVFETEGFVADLKRIARAAGPRVEAKLRTHVYPQLRREPQFGPAVKRLRTWTPDTRRVRIRDWRFFYQLDERERLILMIAADHRREAHE